MSKTFLIVITGLPATGKTTLGRKIAQKFQIPFVCKDNFKEILFDVLGHKDQTWVKKMGIASLDILYHIAEENLKVKKSLVIETNFNPKFANKKITVLRKKYNFTPIQIRCISDGDVLLKRFKKRTQSTERHPGHMDNENIKKWKPVLKKGKIEALKIGGKFFDIDTTNFKSIDYKKLFDTLNSIINIHK